MSKHNDPPVANPPQTLILALGNPLRGDDGVGEAVLQCLRQVELPSHVALLDGGTPGLETVLLLKDYQYAIIVDAAEIGLDPGSWRYFSPDEVVLTGAGMQSTLHYAGLAEALTLGAALEMLPEKVTIYGIQPRAIGWSPGLSAPVQEAVPQVCASILCLLQEEVINHG